MWMTFLAFFVFVAIFTLAAYLFQRWLSRYVQQHVGGRLEAIDRIVNDEQVPEAWLRPYRRRASKLRAGGATDEQLAELSRVARKRCIANIQELIRYAEKVGFTDNEATKRFMLGELRNQEHRWLDAAEWQDLVDLTLPVDAIPGKTEMPDDDLA